MRRGHVDVHGPQAVRRRRSRRPARSRGTGSGGRAATPGFLSANARRSSSRRASSRHRLRRRLTPARISAGGPFEQHLEWRRRSAPATLAVLTTIFLRIPTFMAPARHVWIALAVVTSCGDRRTSGSRSRSGPFAASAAGSRFLVAALLLAAILVGAARRCGSRVLSSIASAIVGGLLLGPRRGDGSRRGDAYRLGVAAIIAGTVPLQIIGLRLIARRPCAYHPLRHARRSGRTPARRRSRPWRGIDRTRACGDGLLDDRVVDESFRPKRLELPHDPFVSTVLGDGARRPS